MMSFWILCGLLVVLALCYVLPPLLQRVDQPDDERERANVSIYRNQFAELDRDLRDGVLGKEQHEQGRIELQRRLLEDVPLSEGSPGAAQSSVRSRRRTAVLLGSAIPILAVLLYFQLGTPQALAPGQPAVARGRVEGAADVPAGPPGAPTQQEIEKRIANLAARLKENPNDPEGWAMLARSYQSFGRHREASDAYARATQLAGNNAQLWADYGESLAMVNNSQWQGRPLEMINKALQVDPENRKALWLAGTAAFQTQDFGQAISYWERLERLLPEGSEAAQSVAVGIKEARTRAGNK